ncbi:MAG: D-tyrosyl-tRNA(Tyr) deacylase [Candidatus Omnitrophica bacterium]|nr:D-tyrosyl-tRNA(Tyr) deacylase [Candidatus Omnitrophota bacterium]
MKVLVVRVHKGEILLEGKKLSAIARGLAIFVSLEKGDSAVRLDQIAEKVINLRIFENQNGKMANSLNDKNYELLCISNFTLSANTSKGRRPSFEDALGSQEASRLFIDFVSILKSKGIAVATGAFGKHMDINLSLDGPVNILLDSSSR